MSTPEKPSVKEAQKAADELPAGDREALDLGAEAEHETGVTREKKIREAEEASGKEKNG